MAETLGAPGNVGDFILAVDGIEERKVGKGGAVVVIGRQALGVLPDGLCRDIGQNVVSLRSRLGGLLVVRYWCPPKLRGRRLAGTSMAGDGGGFSRRPLTNSQKSHWLHKPAQCVGRVGLQSDPGHENVSAGPSAAGTCFANAVSSTAPSAMEPLPRPPVQLRTGRPKGSHGRRIFQWRRQCPCIHFIPNG